MHWFFFFRILWNSVQYAKVSQETILRRRVYSSHKNRYCLFRYIKQVIYGNIDGNTNLSMDEQCVDSWQCLHFAYVGNI